ncbi:cell division control protein-like protein [Mycena leptocephala]|nr:cell division control protein-like protein [Mycena leptocephala]
MDFGGRQQTCVSSRVKLSDLVGVHPCPPSQPGPNDIFTAIFRPKKSPNRLLVDEAATDDNSVATLNPNTMEILGLFRGDTIYCPKRRDTVLICLSSDDVEEGRIQVNKVACNNLRVKLAFISYRLTTRRRPEGNIFDVYLKPYSLHTDPFLKSQEDHFEEA